MGTEEVIKQRRPGICENILHLAHLGPLRREQTVNPFSISRAWATRLVEVATHRAFVPAITNTEISSMRVPLFAFPGTHKAFRKPSNTMGAIYPRHIALKRMLILTLDRRKELVLE